jgi:hypothetical protein
MEIVCEHCGATVVRRKRRRFCSKNCAIEHRRAGRVALFWSQVDKSGGPDACWPWTGGILKPFGYGAFRPRYGVHRKNRAHRFSYELAYGPIPDALCVLHHCDNPPCCNPAHLFLGTRGDNAADRASKHRTACGERNHFTKLTTQQVLDIRERYAHGETRRTLGAIYGVTPDNIRAIVLRLSWKHV